MRCHITHKLRIAVLHAFALKQIAQPRQTRTCLSLECAKRARNDVLTGKNLEQIEWAVFEGAPCSLLRHTGIVLSSQAARCAPYCNHVMRSCMPGHAALEIGARSASSEQLPFCRALPRARRSGGSFAQRSHHCGCRCCIFSCACVDPLCLSYRLNRTCTSMNEGGQNNERGKGCRKT